MKEKEKGWIRFADTSSEELSTYRINPVYTIIYNNNFKPFGWFFEGKIPDDDEEVSAKEFLKAINKRFGWK